MEAHHLRHSSACETDGEPRDMSYREATVTVMGREFADATSPNRVVAPPPTWVRPEWLNEVSDGMGCRIHLKPNASPLNAWRCGDSGDVSCWLDIRDSATESTADSIPVSLRQFEAALREDVPPSGLPVMLAVRCSDGVWLVLRPSSVGLHTVSVETYEGRRHETVLRIPRSEWQRLDAFDAQP